MGVFDRTSLMKVHMLLAAFMLPVAFMFLLTGGLYTWDIKGDYHTTSFDLVLDQPLTADKAALLDLVTAELKQRNKPFIFATGYGGARVAPEFAGTPVVQKPYRMEELASALSQLRASTGDPPLL